jgi:hypothetical protein
MFLSQPDNDLARLKHVANDIYKSFVFDGRFFLNIFKSYSMYIN